MQKKFEVRVHKLEATITMHVTEKDALSEEIVMWKKKCLDFEETNKDLHVEIKRLRRQLEEAQELADMDADEDAMREHTLKKTRHNLKELDIKYHALLKKYDALVHIEAKFHEVETECAMWKAKYE